MIRKKGSMIILYACVLAFFYSVEAFLSKGVLGYEFFFMARFVTAVISVFFICHMSLQGKLYKKWDFWVLVSFFVYVFLVTWFYYGLSIQLFICTYYYMWMNLIFFLLTFRTVKEPDAVLRPVSFIFVLTVSLLECFILVRATLSLKTLIPGSDRVWGCFRVGRLCGMGNANILAFYAITAAMLALLRFLKSKKGIRLFYGFAFFIQWFVMGLTNCRSMIVAFSFTCAVFILARLRKRRMEKQSSAGLRSFVAAGFIAGAVGIFILGSFLLPMHLFKGGVFCLSKVTQDQQMMQNLSLVYARDVTDVDTLVDRELIWKRSVELILKNPRRTLFGISVQSSEPLHGVYKGRHDIPIVFAHNSFLELFRITGFVGICFWIVLLYAWGKNAIKLCFGSKTDMEECFLMAMGAGLLLTGMTEYGSFPYGIAAAIPVAFSICCGYGMRGDSNEKA